MPHFRPSAPTAPAVPAPARVPAAGPSLSSAAHDTPPQVRLGLQQRASTNLRNHLVRGARRFTVLVVADLASFGVMRELLRAVREHALLGGAVADRVHDVWPPGILNGWQYAAALFVALVVTGNYGPGDARRAARRLFFAAALATALPLWMMLWARGLEPVLVQYGLTTVLVWLGLLAERQTIDRIAAKVLPPWRPPARTLFVGPAEQCRAAFDSPAFASGGELRPIGFVDVNVPPAVDARGHIGDFAAVLHRTRAEAVVVCGYLPDARFRSVVDAALASQCQVLSVPRAIQIAGVQPNLVWRREQPLVELTAPTLKGWQLVLKRSVDLLGAAVCLPVASPVMLLVGLAVKLDSAGPVFFTQERVGRGGRLFKIIKFRTMVDGAEGRRDELLARSVYSDPRLLKVPSDPRMTRLGRWLRRTSLDELPQLINVLRGEMSLVGPRPPLPSEVELYEAHHYARFDVKPGITGPWQVNGRNRVTDFERVIALETEYIRRWSLGADLLILLKPCPPCSCSTGRSKR